MSDEDRPRIEESEEEEQEEKQEDEQQEEQEEEAEEEAEGEDDEDEIRTLELFRMIRASETKDHNGPWCTEMAKISYAHISNTNFREKEDLCFHIQVENKWKPLGIAAFMEDRSNKVDQIGVFCEFWDEKKVVGSYAGMDSNRTVKPKEVFEKLVKFEEELKSLKGKNKRKADGEGTVKLKKSRQTVAKVSEAKEMEPPINPMDHFSKKEEEKMMKIDFSKYKDMYPFGVSEIFRIPVTKINEAPSVFVYRSINRNYVMDTYKKMIERPGITPQVADLLPYSLKKKKPIKVEDYATTKGISIRDPRKLLDAMIEDPDCVFVAISGQHSSRAQQLILQEPRISDSLKEKNRYKHSPFQGHGVADDGT
ncbi:hypothetical protein R1sor_026958 [Riccia sorocarpa]|uniref:Uncharacterized protein n=1 Tax=Riccia sorocarpa TaxID=122646 RepID=A0ABD3GCX5_9MARC